MPGPFTITTAIPNTILDKNRHGEAAFTVTNASGQPLHGRAQLSAIQVQPPQGVNTAGWLTVAGAAERDFPIAGTEQFTVVIAVPAGAPPGSYGFRLDMVGDIPDEDYSQGPAVSFKVTKVEPPRPKFPWWIVAVAAGVLVIATIAIVMLLTRKMPVPDVHNMPVADARATLQTAGLQVGDSTTVPDDTVTPGWVVHTTPGAGTEVKRGSKVAMVLSGGPAMIQVPNIRNLPVASAQATLEAVGLRVGSLSTVADATVTPGWVVNTTPGLRTPVAKGSEVDMVLSGGPPPTFTPTPDATKPSVQIAHIPASPGSGDQVTFNATASDAGGIDHIEILVDGTLVKTCPLSSCSYQGGPYSTGNHTYEAKAYDKARNAASTSGQVFSVSSPALDLAEGLMVYYPFRSNADDQGGKGNHGTVEGPRLTNDRYNRSNSAYEFDGQDDVIRIPDHSSLDITGQISLAAWVYPTEQKTQDVILKGPKVNGPSAAPYSLAFSATGDVIFSLRLNGQWTQVRKTGYSLNKWFFMVGTYDGTSMKLYINGRLESSLSVSGSMNTNNDPLLIGTRLNLPADTFKGKIDDVRIYNRALSAVEIQALYTE